MYLSIIKFETRFANLKMNARDAERSALRSYMSGLTSIAFGDLRLAVPGYSHKFSQTMLVRFI